MARRCAKTFFLLGLFIISIRLEGIINVSEDYCYYPDLVNNELVVNEQAKTEPVFTEDFQGLEGISFYNSNALASPSYQAALSHYNDLIIMRLKIFSCGNIFISDLITILQKNNTSHKSSDEESSLNS